MDKYVCKDCGWIGEVPLTSPSPFDREDTLTACPDCRQMEIRIKCEVDDCKHPASCGINTDAGYKWLCGYHYQRA